MRTTETVAIIDEEGTLTATTPELPKGRHRVVIALAEQPIAPGKATAWPNMAAFREQLELAPHPGNTVVEMREDELQS